MAEKLMQPFLQDRTSFGTIA